jgi:hypothetical protein
MHSVFGICKGASHAMCQDDGMKCVTTRWRIKLRNFHLQSDSGTPSLAPRLRISVDLRIGQQTKLCRFVKGYVNTKLSSVA